MRIASIPHSSRALAVLPPKFPLRPWLVLSLLLSFVSGHERIETFSIRFFLGNRKPQSRECHVTTVLLSRLPFGVHVWTTGRAFSGKWLTTRFFFASKNCAASRSKARVSFLYPPVMCYLDFWSRSNELFMFWGEKNKELRIYWKIFGYFSLHFRWVIHRPVKIAIGNGSEKSYTYSLALHPVLSKGVSHALLPSMWPGFESWRRRHNVGWVCCWFSPLHQEVFFSGYFGSPLSFKNNTFKFQFDLERTDMFQRVLNNSQVFRG